MHPTLSTLCFGVALAAASLIGWKIAPDSSEPELVSTVSENTIVSGDRDAAENDRAKRSNPGADSQVVAMPICGSGRRVNCVVDGDTIWVNREKIRLEGFNAPEMNGACARERQLAVRARDELRRVLNGHPFTIERSGQDRYGRTLATVRVNGRDVGQDLIRKGLAHEWRGFKENWC